MHLYAIKSGMKKPGYLLPDLSQREFPTPPASGTYDLICIGITYLQMKIATNQPFCH